MYDDLGPERQIRFFSKTTFEACSLVIAIPGLKSDFRLVVLFSLIRSILMFKLKKINILVYFYFD
jgi:hypothetical protein